MPERTAPNERAAVPCPVCHRTLDDSEFEHAHLCNKCLALHHEKCWTGGCASCGAVPDVKLDIAPKKKAKTKRRAKAGGPWETVKLLAAIAWVPSFVLGLAAIMIALKLGWTIYPFEDTSFVLRALMFPYEITAVALTGIMSADAILRGLAQKKGSGWPIVIAVLGLCTGGISAFAYFLGWGRTAIGDAPEDR